MTDWTTARVTPEMLAELRRLAEAATPGPWYLDGPWWYGDDDSAYCISTAEDAGRIAVTIAPPRYIFGGEREVRDANARFIAAANPAAVLALLDAAAERDALAAKVERVRALHQREVIAVHFEFGPEAWCPTCELHYPCPTARALDEENAQSRAPQHPNPQP